MGQRIDGRDTKTVRPISCEVGVLPRAHGAALFTRGETQAIVVTTLGTKIDPATAQIRVDGEKVTVEPPVYYLVPWQHRYRFPIEWMLFLLAGAGVWWLLAPQPEAEAPRPEAAAPEAAPETPTEAEAAAPSTWATATTVSSPKASAATC